MSSTPFDTGLISRAERQFREAFERLKERNPMHLPKGSRVTQNNVAKEAGAVPSALRRARYPALVDEIQAWIAEHREDSSQQSTRQKVLAHRRRNRGLRDRNDELIAERDDAFAKLASAEARIIELTVMLERAKAFPEPTNVSPIRLKPSRQHSIELTDGASQ